ncbi:MAG TPA: hypothetical protein VKB86_17640 [Pyrinomonadaceae bacterium]|nr:hypothetical protein [Pyrinomonadaceae bacterium]
MDWKRSGLIRLILLALVSLGGWLALGSGVSFLIGFILAVSSASVLIYLMRQAISRPLTQRENKVWSHMSEGGRSRYILKAVLRGLLVGVVGSSIALFNSVKEKGLNADNVEIFFAVVFVSVFTFYYMAVKFWDVNEKRSKKP